MPIKKIFDQSRDYKQWLENKKAELDPSEFGWYPYGTLDNFYLVEKLLTGANRDLASLVGNKPVADIGAADGDSAFFLESLGFEAHVVDFPPTNFNGCRGVRLLKSALSSRVDQHASDAIQPFARWCRS
jgi:hypothetical protein